MKEILEGFVVAFSMYSKIPMPKLEWNEKNMRYCICYFPLIGLVIGLILYGFGFFTTAAGRAGLLRAAVLTVLPLLVTGGIHMDGFLDTADAVSSWKSREEKLEIMKDSHAGAFAVIAGLCYMVLYFAAMSEADVDDLWLIGLCCALSRAWSGLGLLILRKAKNTGLLRTFSDRAAVQKSTIVMIGWIVLVSAALIVSDPVRGGAVVCLGAGVFVWYRAWAYRSFGGITGDLEGFFLQLFELLSAIAIVLI